MASAKSSKPRGLRFANKETRVRVAQSGGMARAAKYRAKHTGQQNAH